jgi:hypothetical protein
MGLLEMVIDTAIKTILEKGEHMPTLYVEYKNREVALIFMTGVPDDTLARQKYFFVAGRKVGMESPGRKVKQLIFADEGWMASHPVDAPSPYPYKRPSDDPDRKEVLLIQSVDVSNGEVKQSLQTFEMLRGDGTIDLLAGKRMTEDVSCYLLVAFLAGISSADMNDKQFKKFLRKYDK